MENKLHFDVTCQSQEIAAKYEELARKMLNDKEFHEALKNCKSEREIYDLYVKHGYTDLPYEEFAKQLGDTLHQIQSTNLVGNAELTMEELEGVVGGFSFFNFFTSVISVIPIAGPIISGVAKAVKAGVDGKGFSGVVLELAEGAGLAMVDAVVTIATAGAGTTVATGIRLGMAGIKFGLTEATE